MLSQQNPVTKNTRTASQTPSDGKCVHKGVLELVRHGGEGGIRTHGRISPTHAFQACSLNRSDTSPKCFSNLTEEPREVHAARKFDVKNDEEKKGGAPKRAPDTN